MPGTSFKVGLDPIIGLIPVAGDAVAALVGGWVIIEAARFGIPRIVLARMVLNLSVDLAIGLIPIIGDLYDFVFTLELAEPRPVPPACARSRTRRRAVSRRCSSALPCSWSGSSG